MTDDLISRQAAIDAIRAFYDEYTVYDYGKSIEDLISELPSAEPERWISMADKHPDDGQRVLMQFINGTMHVLPFSATGLTTHIAAWMPLPKPWKGEEDDND